MCVLPPPYAGAAFKFDSGHSGNFDSAAEVQAAIAAGAAVDNDVIRSFECPVIPVAANA